MSQKHLILTVIGFALAIVVPAVVAEDETAQIEWCSIEDSGIVIEFEDEMESLALQLLPEAVKRLKEVRVGEDKELERLIENRDKVLQFIARQLGLDEPSKNMAGVFDKFTVVYQQVIRFMPDPRHIRIWRREKLKRLLIAGENIPSFSYNPDTDKVEYKFERSSKDKAPFSTGPFPMVIKDDPTKKAIEQAIEQINESLGMLKQLPSISCGGICHEVAEFGIVWDIGIKSPYRRWFCDGVADYIAGQCVKEFCDKSTCTDFLKSLDVAKYKHLKDQVNLLTWRAGEWERESPYLVDGEISNAYYAFSTHEIFGLVDRHGRDVIPSIFKEIAKSEVRNEQTIFDAIKKVTKEDFRTVLKKYGTRSADQFKGLAIKHFVVGICEKDDKGKWHMTKETTTIPYKTDGKHGVCLHFHYATMNLPVALKVELVGPPKANGPGEVATQTGELTKQRDVVESRWWFTSGDPLGEYHIKTYFDDKLYKDVKIMVVERAVEET